MAWFDGSAVLLLVTLHLFTVTICDAAKTKHVKITNTLEKGQTLNLHCKSGDDDLGLQTLPPNASFAFHFKPSFIAETQFYCSFEWLGAFHWFDIYDDFRDGNYCGTCNWVVFEGHPCLWNWDTNKYDKCYKWNE